MTCLFLSELWFVAGSFHFLKGIPKVYSVEEEYDMAWEVRLCNIGEYQHIASLYDQGKMDISQTSQARVWKCHGCRGYSSQGMDTSSNVSWFREATHVYFQTRIPLQFWEINQSAASLFLSPGTLYGFSIIEKELLTCSPFWRTLRCHEQSFFSISGKTAHSQFIQPGQNCQFTNSANKHLEVSWFNRETNTVEVLWLQWHSAQESKTCLFPT